MYSLGIDIGSSFVKAAVFSLSENKTVESKTFPSFQRLENPDPKKFEISAEEIFTTITTIIHQTAEKYRLSGIFFATQMHGFVYSVKGIEDKYISWQDSRSTNPLADGATSIEALETLIPPEILRSTGVSLKPSLGICNLYALLKEEPHLPKNGTLYTLGSYIISRLTGNNITHITNAAPLGIVDVKRSRVNPEILNCIGLGDVILPQLSAEDYASCGEYSAAGQTVPVFPDYGDHQVSVLGAGVPAGYGIINIATASQVGFVTPTLSLGDYEARPYFGGRHLNTISNMPGGRNLQVLTDFIGDCICLSDGVRPSTGEVWQLINSRFSPSESPLRVDTLFYPTKTSSSGGSITGITPDNFFINQLFTSAYQNMAEIYKKHLPLVCGGTMPKGVVFSGGVSWKNPILINMVGGLLNINYQKSAEENEVFSGLGQLALQALGE